MTVLKTFRAIWVNHNKQDERIVFQPDLKIYICPVWHWYDITWQWWCSWLNFTYCNFGMGFLVGISSAYKWQIYWVKSIYIQFALLGNVVKYSAMPWIALQFEPLESILSHMCVPLTSYENLAIPLQTQFFNIYYKRFNWKLR